ncbi:MAG: hypothetical protein ACI4D9_00360 [Lachnospiraceae bacterium]
MANCGVASVIMTQTGQLTEWGVVGVIIALIGLFATVYAPMAKNTKENTKAMTELAVNIKNLTKQFEIQEANNEKTVKRIWNHNDEQDDRILELERRVMLIEERGSQSNE